MKDPVLPTIVHCFTFCLDLSVNVLSLHIGEILGPSNFDKKVALIALICFQGGGGGGGGGGAYYLL